MRILMTSDTVGGVWSFTCELVTGLLEAGAAIMLISVGPRPNLDQRRWTDQMKDRWSNCFAFESLDAPLEWMPENELAFCGASDALIQFSRQFGADLIHSNQFCFGALDLDIPKIITAHSDVLSWGKACRSEGMEESQWLRQYRDLLQAGLSGADAVVAPTQWMLNALAENAELSCDTQVIPNGRLVPSLPTGPRRMQAVTAGRLWDEAKNVALLYQVTSPIPIMVAGDHLGLSVATTASPVKLIGRLSEAELLTVFQRSEMYICSSRYEPFGLAALEAALSGCAVLANDIASLHEVWQDGALYFDSASSLSDLLSKLYSNLELLAEAKRRSFEQAQKYSRERMTASYLALFQTILQRHHEMPDVA